MLFNSLEFLVFFPTVVVLYFLTPHRGRWVLLLAASYFFYMSWKPAYILLIVASTLVDYTAGRGMERARTARSRRGYLIASLGANLGLLFVFKYFNFFSSSARGVLGSLGVSYETPVVDLLLPVGISFYTFQTLSYTIDVYQGKRSAEKHLGIFALYVAFFPQLVAGPIERSVNLIPQFYARHRLVYARVVSGLQLMLWGLFKKIVIADRLAVYVDAVYNQPGDHNGGVLTLATYFFAFQIYCDFSGYSDIAIGAARVLGFDLMENFRRPYFAKSVGEFWQRWHISLSTWFRDYVYIPLGGNRVGARRLMANLMTVFVVSGLWHGANWTFVVWGALHGTYVIAGRETAGLRRRIAGSWPSRFPNLHRCLQSVVVFHLVCLAWIFFRANSVGDAFFIVSNLLSGWELALPTVPGFGATEIVLSLVLIGLMEAVHLVERDQPLGEFLNGLRRPLRWAAYYALIFAIFLLGNFDANQFIYFQF